MEEKVLQKHGSNVCTCNIHLRTKNKRNNKKNKYIYTMEQEKKIHLMRHVHNSYCSYK
jgi:hypothetical protein